MRLSFQGREVSGRFSEFLPKKFIRWILVRGFFLQRGSLLSVDRCFDLRDLGIHFADHTVASCVFVSQVHALLFQADQRGTQLLHQCAVIRSVQLGGDSWRRFRQQCFKRAHVFLRCGYGSLCHSHIQFKFSEFRHGRVSFCLRGYESRIAIKFREGLVCILQFVPVLFRLAIKQVTGVGRSMDCGMFDEVCIPERV